MKPTLYIKNPMMLSFAQDTHKYWKYIEDQIDWNVLISGNLFLDESVVSLSPQYLSVLEVIFKKKLPVYVFL